MLELTVSPAQVSASRFAVSPAAELINALEVLVQPERAPFARRWVATTARDLDRARVATLLALFEGSAWYVPDFLAPVPSHDGPDLDADLAAVASTPESRVRAELVKAFPRAIPHEVAAVLDRSGEAGLAKTVATEMAAFWAYAMDDLWESIRSVLDDEIRRQASTIARRGFGTALDDLHPGVVRHEAGIRLDRPYDLTADVGEGLVLLPSVFLPSPAVWLATGYGPAMLGYPAEGRGRVWVSEPGAGDGAGIFGVRLTTLLADLDVPRTTGELGRRHSLAPSTVSYHLARLLRAGLVVRRKDGSRVLYSRTERADATIKALYT